MNKKCIRPQKSDWRANQVKTQRAFCNVCIRPERVCLCEHITIEDNRCTIGILQHPNEVGKTFNTAKIAELSLKNSFLIEGINFDDNQDFNSKLGNFEAHQIGVLYPSASAIDLSEAPSDLSCLIIVDGTWPEAKKILNRTNRFKTVQHYAFTPSSVSKYSLRKEPQDNYVCSLEAVVESLRIIDQNKTAYYSLLDTLEKMIELQEALRFTNSRHKSSSNYTITRKRIKEIKRILFSSNVEHLDISKLQIELKELEKQLLNSNY